MIFMYLLIECRHHRRLLPALSFHVKSSPASGGGGGEGGFLWDALLHGVLANR